MTEQPPTDKEKLIEVFNDVGIEFKEMDHTKSIDRLPRGGIEIDHEYDYRDFFTQFYFDDDCKFVGHRLWGGIERS